MTKSSLGVTIFALAISPSYLRGQSTKLSMRLTRAMSSGF